jgi:transcription initiation factor TFIIIB Brf1 subunit/transcription initiation factor TFIIB
MFARLHSTTATTSPVAKEECAHTVTVQRGGAVFCHVCGEETHQKINYDRDWKFYGTTADSCGLDPERCYLRKTQERSIHADIHHLAISEHIKDLANGIYNDICSQKIHRGIFRKSIVFAAVFYAYKVDRTPQSCDHLINLFKIKRKSALKGLKYVNEHLPPRSPLRTLYITPEDLIQEFIGKYDTTPAHVAALLDLFHRIKGRSDVLNRSRPQSIAAGVIYYFSVSQGRPLNLKEFVKKVHLSELTVVKVAKECSTVLGEDLKTAIGKCHM